jgi:hypothetical protein
LVLPFATFGRIKLPRFGARLTHGPHKRRAEAQPFNESTVLAHRFSDRQLAETTLSGNPSNGHTALYYADNPLFALELSRMPKRLF